MKKLIMLGMLLCPCLCLAQAVTLSPNTILPIPQLKHSVSSSTTKGKPNVVSGSAGTEEEEEEGTKPNTGQNKDGNGAITIGGKSLNGTTSGGTTYNPLTGGITTNGTTINGVTTGGIKGTDGAITNGITKGGTTFGGTTQYSAWVLNTNFTIPLVRVNFLVNKPQNSTNSLASTSFFNSVGAGINISNGELDVTNDPSNTPTSIKFYNHIGFNFGFLFAANSSSGTSTTSTSNSTTPTQPGTPSTTSGSTTTTSQSSTIFALVAGISILNFQVGGGYELGSLTPGQRRGFLAISYAIPVSALIDGGYKVLGVNKLTMPQY